FSEIEVDGKDALAGAFNFQVGFRAFESIDGRIFDRRAMGALESRFTVSCHENFLNDIWLHIFQF
ncbi:hypothetical protein ACFL6N_07105, partial [Thermodesulfobacteriota bacterium]